MKWNYLLSVVALVIVFTVVGAQDGAIPTVTAVATDEGIEFPPEVATGFVNINFENNRSEAPITPIIARINDGISIDDLAAAMAEDEMAAVSMLSLYGGMEVAAGETLSYTTELILGNYVILESEGDGFATFTVTEGDMTDMAEPESDVHLAMVDFGFGVPAFMPAGTQVWHLENIGDQWHEVAMFKAPEGINSTADILDAMAAGQTEEPEQAFFWAPMGAGTQAWVTIDLEPGTYALLCFLPDFEGDFSPHMEHGMIQVFTVE